VAMGGAEEYRRRAMRFLELAEQITDPDRRGKAIDLAIKWMRRARESSEAPVPVEHQKETKRDIVDC
jgi:hypothetical protein